jgi:hypothetical protein
LRVPLDDFSLALLHTKASSIVLWGYRHLGGGSGCRQLSPDDRSLRGSNPLDWEA